MINVAFIGTESLRKIGDNAKAAKLRFRENIIKASKDFSQKVLGLAKDKYLSGGADDVLKVRTGNLRRNIRSMVDVSGDTVTTTWGTNVKYGPIHEFGGPMRSSKGKVWYMPERSFLRRPLEDRIDEYKDTMLGLIGDLEKELLGGL